MRHFGLFSNTVTYPQNTLCFNKKWVNFEAILMTKMDEKKSVISAGNGWVIMVIIVHFMYGQLLSNDFCIDRIISLIVRPDS